MMALNSRNFTSGSFEYFDHAADLGIRVQAPTLAGLFVAAARALMTWIGPAPEPTVEREWKVSLEAEDLEGLLVRWLQELLYIFYQHHAYFAGVSRLDFVDRTLDSIMLVRLWRDAAHESYQEVKAITYHKLQVSHHDSGWSATVIVDI